MDRLTKTCSLLLKLSAVCGILFVTISCEEVIDSPFEIIESKLVIASTFRPHEPVLVRLTATQPITGELQATDIKTAKVVLFEGTTFIEELAFVEGQNGSTGFYTTSSFKPEINHHYTMHASADGFTPVSADSKIPTSVEISSIKVNELTTMRLLNTEVYDYFLEVDYADPENVDNFYDLRISQEVIPYRTNLNGDTTFFPSILKSVQPPGLGVGTTSAARGQASILLRDKPSPEGVTIQLQSVIDPEKELLGSIVAELRTVSEPYFLFQRNIQGEGDVFSGIIERRVNSYTNITSGYGVFAGYSSFVKTFQLQRQ